MLTLREALARGPLLVDGAMGSLIYERGVFLTSCFEEINLQKPELVHKIHEDYVVAGAQIIGTNTYGANRIRLADHDRADATERIVRAGVEIARDAARGHAWVAGCVGPTGLDVANMSTHDEARITAAFREQIGTLLDAGVDAIALETFNHLDEILLAMKVVRERAPDTVLIAQMAFSSDQRTLEGRTPETVATKLAAGGADVIGVNCSEGPGLVFKVAERMLGAGVPVSAQPNAGTPESIEGRVIYVANPEYFGVFARRLLKRGIRVIGGCCGTRPEHTQRMAQAVRMLGGGRSASTRGVALAPTTNPGERAVTPLAERSAFGAKLGRELVVSVEINPPPGFDASALFRAAKRLRAAGVTVINVSDGPRASARMGNVAFATALQREAAMETILHVCCRDRSLLGLVAHLLGAHYQGLRNLVVITGDPPKLGDYPESTGVYDLDSIGLLGLVRNMNRGIDPAGKPMPEPTHFVLATGAEPGALDYERELMRLAAKREAGAELVMTQPVFDLQTLDRFLDDTRALGLPVLLGVLPLASARNAAFLCENVPGMRVPDDVMARMRAAGEGQAARAVGVAIAREMVAAARDRIQGLYVMPPLNHYEMAEEIVAGYVGAGADLRVALPGERLEPPARVPANHQPEKE